MTLTRDRLLLTDSWYKLSDGTEISEVKVPYILQRLALPGKSGVAESKLTASVQERMANDFYASAETKQSSKPTNSKDKNRYKLPFLHTTYKYKPKKQKRSHVQNKMAQHRILRNFQQVAAALTSGYDVYFRVELSACAVPDQVKVDRASFGGMIKNFVFVRQDGSRSGRRDYIYFISHKTVMGNQGECVEMFAVSDSGVGFISDCNQWLAERGPMLR